MSGCCDGENAYDDFEGATFSCPNCDPDPDLDFRMIMRNRLDARRDSMRGPQ